MTASRTETPGAPRSLYAHFPFCVHRCHYCDFAVSRSSSPPVEQWLEAIDQELDQWFGERGWPVRESLGTIFVGGGTPSLMAGTGMSRLAEVLGAWFSWSPGDVEWTAESNPASLDAAALDAWLEVGVNRLSVGVQSFDDEVLRWLGRLHDSERARRALAAAVTSGFNRINLDLIFGLPESLPRDWRAEVQAAVDCGVTHVSVYGLTAERATPLGRWVESGEVRLAGDECYANQYLAASDELTRAGFIHYEVSNFALPGHECLHNWHYWDGSAYLGVGPSAHSYIDGRRSWNVSRWEAYRRTLSEGGSPREGSEAIGAGESRLERLWLALRTNRGVPDSDPLSAALLDAAGDLLTTWKDMEWLAPDPGATVLTAAGWLRMDEMVAALGARFGVTRDGLRDTD